MLIINGTDCKYKHLWYLKYMYIKFIYTTGTQPQYFQYEGTFLKTNLQNMNLTYNINKYYTCGHQQKSLKLH